MTGRRARVEGSAAPTGRKPAADLPAVIAGAMELAGDDWHTIKTWPLESGLVWLAEKLKG